MAEMLKFKIKKVVWKDRQDINLEYIESEEVIRTIVLDAAEVEKQPLIKPYVLEQAGIEEQDDILVYCVTD